MPWCEDCSRFYNPNSLEADGSCPTCGRRVADPAEPAERADKVDGRGAVAAEPGAPWHFKLLVVGVVGYLGWRVVQGLDWLAGLF